MYWGKVVAGWLLVASPFFVWAGHDDVNVNPAMKRYAGKITGMAEPDPQGRVFGFSAQPLPAGTKYPPNELRGWRLTILSGKRFSSVFEVQSNTASEVVVAQVDGPLTGVAVNDLFVIEEIAVERKPQ